jgi:elongation factor P--(R)-beta-lysine ligase
MLAPSPPWRPHVHADRRPLLLARGQIVRALRRFFEERGFVEVETPALQVSPGNETHLHAFQTEIVTGSGARARLYLHTSPEFACKKLLAAGERRIVNFARVFRNRERSALHHPEFTLLEWYRAEQSYDVLMSDCAEVLATAAEAAGTKVLSWRGETADPFASPERLTVAEAFVRHAGFDLMQTIGPAGETDREAFAGCVRAAGLRVSSDDTWSDLFSRAMVVLVEPRLGHGRATILHEYPVSEATLARFNPADPRTAERFELYVCGVELANAFGELTDAAEQRRRFDEDMAEKERIYGQRYPLDEDFLAALAHMPSASGIALGLDRLVMLATGARRIEDVLWAPVADPNGRT